MKILNIPPNNINPKLILDVNIELLFFRNKFTALK